MNVPTMARRAKTVCLTMLATLWVTSPVWADDTEIFFADTSSNPIFPNVLFIIDTSGSMGTEVEGTGGNDRLEEVQIGFRQLLGELSNVNVGVMRFSNPGGPVLFPVTDIDSELTSVRPSEVSSRVRADSDDAQEIITSGEILLNEDVLVMSRLSAGVERRTYRVTQSDRDAEERISDGEMDDLDSVDLDARGASEGSPRILGVKFKDLEIPDDATVLSARINFTVRDVEEDAPIYLEIAAEPDDSGDIESSDDCISSRDRTSARVNWDIPAGLSDGDTLSTPNLATILNEVTEDESWNDNETDVTFILDPGSSSATEGHVELYSYDGAPSVEDGPELVIEWYRGTLPGPEETITAMRFENLDIPRGVTVTNAYIEFTADRNQGGDFAFEVTAELDGSPATFTTTNTDVRRRASITPGVSWTGGGLVSAGESYRTSNLAALVQTVAARDDWCGGNDMAFGITGTSGLRTAWSHDGNPSLAPRLVVQYDFSSIPNGTSCYRGTISRRIVNSSDDIEEKGSSVDRTSSTLNLESGTTIGLRFTDVGVPKGATIFDARIEFTERAEQDTVDTTMVIAVENDTGDAEGFGSEDGAIEDRTFDGTTYTWNITDDWFEDNSYQTGDISDLVENAVKNAGWSAGNAMVFKVTTTGDRDRRAYTFDSSPGQAARLIVDFEADGADTGGRKVREELLAIVDGLNHNGWTPVQATLYEAANYYMGNEVVWGTKRGGGNGENGPHAYTRVSAESAMVPGTFQINNPAGCSSDDLDASDCAAQTISGIGGSPMYKSPITDSCQKINHIIMLTDGFANKDHSGDEIRTMTGLSSCTDAGTGDGGTCVQDLARFMRETDLSPLNLDQNVVTHTIGFDFEESEPWLRAVAAAGGGEFAFASNSQELVDAIKDIILGALKVDNTFVAPVAAVNQFNRLNNLDDIYFAVFRPDEVPAWPGNLKKYNLGTNNEVLDAANQPAVDAGTGFFKDGSKDVWNATNTADGKQVEFGGAGSLIPDYVSRNVYSYHSNSTTTDLSDSSNAISLERVDDGQLTKTMFNAGSLSDDQFDQLIDWMRGRSAPDPNNPSVQPATTRFSFSDPLHSRPVAVTYNAPDPNDPDNQDVEIFLGTNGGGLHAFNAQSGVETFVWFPEATFGIQQDLLENKATVPHVYGIDGSIVPWIQDNGGNGISAGEGDFVRLFFGMRRGGNNYYSLDVTDRSAPEFRWVIEGGQGDFAEMGQSWGTPVRGKIQLKDQPPKDVLFISGGYDPAKDDLTLQGPDNAGRAIYIVDAETGALIWSGGPSDTAFTKEFVDMKYSIPSGLTLADIDSDGLDDVIFVGDTGGQVWRFDLLKNQEVADLVRGGVIADLGVAGGVNTELRNRRFFHAPDVALIRDRNDFELAVTIGSGFRPSPLSKVTEDAFFMIRQRAVFGPPTAYNKLTIANLFDATDNRVGDGVDGDGNIVSQVDARTDLEAKEGWYIDLHNSLQPGEKVLSTPLTLDNTVTFVTYTPSGGIVDCNAVAGLSRVYAVNISDATPSVNFPGLETIDETARAYQLNTPSIIDEPVVICTGEGCDVFTGAEQPPLDEILNSRITRTYWRKEQ